MKRDVGLYERVKVIGSRGQVETIGKFDTGARRTSIDYDIAAKAGLGPVIGVKHYKSGLGRKRRVLVKAELVILGRRFNVEANLSNREHSPAKVLIGRDIIFGNFIVDPEKSHSGPDEKSVNQKYKKRLGL